MNFFRKEDFKYLLLITITSILTVLDLFVNVGRSANGDGFIHTVAPTLFANAITQGNFPVGWTEGFANYGYPLGSISQQLTTYLTAFITIFLKNPIIGFNICIFLGVLLSSIFLYYFLRIYFPPLYSFVGVLLFSLSPYRILNIYVRGALPEFFAGVFFPLLLIAAYLLIKKKNINGLFLLVISISLLILSHPFMLIVSMFLFIPYVGFLLFKDRKNIKSIFLLAGGILLGVLITSYYSFPLFFEIRYFYYGASSYHLTPNSFLGIKNFFHYNYPYFTKLDIFGRGFFVNAGLIESLIVLISLIYLILSLFSNKLKVKLSIFHYALFTGLLFAFMTLKWSGFIYSNISILSNIQFPWRMLSGFIFIPPILLAYLLSKIKSKVLVLLAIILICIIAFPQLYGKNYTNYNNNFYNFTEYNLNAVVMNTIWTGRSEDYPIKNQKWGIIEGNGKVIKTDVSNSKRIYEVIAENQIRMVDYTFYFPGWKVFVDKVPTTIEFQNSNYRGVITYLVPAGKHTVEIKYTDTKIRQLGKILSIFFIVLFVFLFLLRKKISKLTLLTTGN